MKKLFIFISIFAIFILSAACDDSQITVEEGAQKPPQIEESLNTTNGKPTLEKLLAPPDFILKKLDISYDEMNNEFNWVFDYSFSNKVYDVLSKPGETYFLNIEFSDEVKKIIAFQTTDFIEGPQVKGNLLSYEVVFKRKIKEAITDEQIKFVKQNIKNYTLNIADKDHKLVAVFKNMDVLIEIPND